MVIRGASRGNGKQLAEYLLATNDNEKVQILDVAGRDNRDKAALNQTLLSMSLTSELTRSDKGLYHAQINPAYGEDKLMTAEQWHQAADIMANQLGLSEQRRVMVLHTKKGRTHAHVVWERYDSQKGKMVSDSYSRIAQDKARQEIEKTLKHQPTPVRNPNRPEMKNVLTDLWNKFKIGFDFIKAAKDKGYTIAAGVQRRPFMVVDDTGRSFDLVRQLSKVKTNDVREKLKDEKLPTEKEVISKIREHQNIQTQEQKIESPVENFRSRDEAILKEAKELKKQQYIKELQDMIEKHRMQQGQERERG